LLFKNLAAWAEQGWRCLSCGSAIDTYLADTELPIFKMYRRVVANLAQSIELKRLTASGAEPTPETMRGLTIPRPVHATSVEHIGKEVIVDPTDTSEDLTAEELNATEPVIYRSGREKLDVLRARIKACGISRVARAAGISRSQIKAFVNQGKTPFASTIAKIEAAFQRLRA
jgi:DNA-binding phage protein